MRGAVVVRLPLPAVRQLHRRVPVARRQLEVAAGGVSGHPPLAARADEPVHRHALGAGQRVPQRQIHPAQRHLRQPAAPVGDRHPVQLVPRGGDVAHVVDRPPDQKPAQVVVDHVHCRLPAADVAVPDHPHVGNHPHRDLPELRLPRIGRRQPPPLRVGGTHIAHLHRLSPTRDATHKVMPRSAHPGRTTHNEQKPEELFGLKTAHLRRLPRS